MRTGSASPRLALPAGISIVLHGSLFVFAVLAARGEPAALPDVYQVDLIAAPAGPRAVGQVAPRPAPAPETPVAPPKRAVQPETSPVPGKPTTPARRAPAPATPVPNARSAPRDAPAPQAGGGATGGAGADVANVKTEGVAFPYPGYLENIVRQIALRFKPSNPGALRAEVVFLVRRDGSITGFTFRQRSGSFAFDLEAQGAVEAAARSGSLGPLPDGFSDDVLTIIFSFDPQLIR